MAVTGFVLFVILIALAMFLDRRGRAGPAIVVFIISGVVLGGTAVGPPLHRATSAAVNGLVNAAVNFFQSI